MPAHPPRRADEGGALILASNRNESAKARPAGNDILSALDRPVPAGVNAAGFGSDVVADALRATEIPYIALNPGASYRGLHDSLVNYLGNERPQMLLCLHEESAVAIAHGYAKVTGKAMAAAVHSNVGLLHAIRARWSAATPNGTTSRHRQEPPAKRFYAPTGLPTRRRVGLLTSISTR